MDALDFLNQMGQYAALNNYTRHIEKTGIVDPDTGAIAFGGWPAEAQEIYAQAESDGENPKWVMHSNNRYVTHNFEGDTLRMVCWAEMGPDKFNKTATAWWKENNPAQPPSPPPKKQGLIAGLVAKVKDKFKPDPFEKELAPWTRKMALEGMSILLTAPAGQMDAGVAKEVQEMLDKADTMSDWDLWLWLDKFNLWYHGGAVSGFVKTMAWPRPFYQAPDRPTPVPASTHWAYTWTEQPFSRSVNRETPLTEPDVLNELTQKFGGRLPKSLSIWPYDDITGRAL